MIVRTLDINRTHSVLRETMKRYWALSVHIWVQ
jgi:hypothetical protein